MNSWRGRPWFRWLVLGVVVGLLGLVAAVAARPLGERLGAFVPAASDTVPASMFSPSSSALPAGSGAVSPAPTISSFPAASAAKVDSAIQAAGVQSDVTVAVRDLGSGTLLYGSGADNAIIPASSMKLMTTISLIDKVGADTTFTTKVVLEPDGSITLVGGGDPLLMSTPSAYSYGDPIPATTQQLAQLTATALKARGTTRVALGYDDSLFSGAAQNPGWQSDDMNYVSDISALMVDEGTGTTTPAATAARTFAGQLQSDGITVTGTPTARTADSSATSLASVQSLPLAEIVRQCLRNSDNTVAEVLFRHLALAYGRPGSFDGGVAALQQAMTALGLWSSADSLHDGSGLNESDRLTAASLSKAIVLAASRDDLRNVLSGLPVAAATGTLETRFIDSSSSAGGGRIRAKTGTLDVSSALVGYTPTADGAMVAFAIVANGVGTEVRPSLDKMAASLAACGCRA